MFADVNQNLDSTLRDEYFLFLLTFAHFFNLFQSIHLLWDALLLLLLLEAFFNIIRMKILKGSSKEIAAFCTIIWKLRIILKT